MAEQNINWDDVEKQLRDRAAQKGLGYDPSDLEGIKRNTSYDEPGKSISLDQALQNQFDIYDTRSSTQRSADADQPPPQSVAQSWTNSGQVQQQPLPPPQQSERNNELWQILMDRAMTSKDVSASDPIIRPQVDAYRAEQERTRRNDIADLAERSGPLANLRGEERLAAERVGQNVSGFQAQLMGRELTARREEIQQALVGLQGLLSTDEQLALQRELALLDNAIRQQQVGLQAQGLDLDWRRALLQNDQFWADLGLRAEDRASYWDAVRSGQISN